jgi:hypothetical protein
VRLRALDLLLELKAKEKPAATDAVDRLGF